MVSPTAARVAGPEPRVRKLVVNDDEARIVIDIYRRYLPLKSVHALREELADAGIKSKRRLLNRRKPHNIPNLTSQRLS